MSDELLKHGAAVVSHEDSQKPGTVQAVAPNKPGRMMKTCTRCGETRNDSAFRPQNRVCRACGNAQNRISNNN